MTLTPSSHQYPTAIFDQQIVYVTDNDRDAEAVSCEIDCPVVEDGSTIAIPVLHSPIVVRKHSKRLDAQKVRNFSKVSNIRKGRDVSDIRNFWEVSQTPNVREVSNFSKVSKGSDFPKVSIVREVSDAPKVRDVLSHNL